MPRRNKHLNPYLEQHGATRAFRSQKPEEPTPSKGNQFAAYRTELSINDIRAAAWNASQGNQYSYERLAEQKRKLAKIANNRLKALKTAHLDMFAYDRAITYLKNQGKSKFSETLSTDYTSMVTELSELVTFINSKSSTVGGAKTTLHKKMQAISEATGHEYTPEQEYNLGRLLSDDSVSTLLRDVRGDSLEVIEVLEELSLTDLNENKEQIKNAVDNYLVGYDPFGSDWSINSKTMNYDEMMKALRSIADKSGEWVQSSEDIWEDI